MLLKNKMKISEIAKLTGLNTRTFHYYDQIGLFSPESKGANGYRYYSIDQLYELGIIMSLKELGMPLKEIKVVLSSEDDVFRRLLEEKKNEVELIIQKYKDIQQVIDRKIHLFELADRQLTEVRIIEIPDEYLIISEPMTGTTMQHMIETAYNLLINRGTYFFINNDFGTMAHSQTENAEEFNYFFLKSTKTDYNFVKPAGRYLQYIHKGNEEKLKLSYEFLKEYIHENDLEVTGYIYERALEEPAQKNLDAYIAEIQVRVI